MPYRDRLNGWAVVRLLPNFQRAVVARFRNPSDAEGHFQQLCRLIPDAKFIVVFDPPDQQLELPMSSDSILIKDCIPTDNRG
jgi:hypothetical protein